MSQAVKYTVLGIAIAAILVSAAAIINSLSPSDILTGFGTALQNFITSASSVISNVRGALNYVIGSPLPVNICLAMALVVPFARFGYRVAITMYRFINQ